MKTLWPLAAILSRRIRSHSKGSLFGGGAGIISPHGSQHQSPQDTPHGSRQESRRNSRPSISVEPDPELYGEWGPLQLPGLSTIIYSQGFRSNPQLNSEALTPVSTSTQNPRKKRWAQRPDAKTFFLQMMIRNWLGFHFLLTLISLQKPANIFDSHFHKTKTDSLG